MTDLRALAVEDHREAEMMRIRMGMDGCGCTDCQDYYGELELGVYGKRVRRYFGVTLILAGRAGADLYQERDDYWTPDGSTFVHYGRKYGVTKSGRSVCFGPVAAGPTSASDATETPQHRQIGVAKLPGGTQLPPTPTSVREEPGIMQHRRGRPRKTGEVHRATAWRRRQQEAS